MTPTFDQISSTLNNASNGANIILEWERPLATYKTLGEMNIRKRVCMVGRKGISHEQMKLIKERNANGFEPTREPWFYHNENDTKGIIRHKRTDVPYVQLFVGTDSNHTPKVKYFMDGNETTWEDVKQYVTKADHPKEHGKYDVTFVCKIEDMIKIKTEIVPTDINVEPTVSEVEIQETAEA